MWHKHQYAAIFTHRPLVVIVMVHAGNLCLLVTPLVSQLVFQAYCVAEAQRKSQVGWERVIEAETLVLRDTVVQEQI